MENNIDGNLTALSPDMEIRLIAENKEQYLDLLLLADEEEAMIAKYLYRGDLFALYDGDLKSICVVTDEENGVFEIQNIATYERYHRQGYASALIKHLFVYYEKRCRTMLVGTGDSPNTIPFYEHCGFIFSHRIENYMIDHYPQPIMENGIQLFDKIYLKKDF